MELISLHNHTVFCDGKSTMEEFVKSALQGGASAIGFSGHAHLPFDERYCMTVQDEIDYNAEFDRLKEKYRGQIRLFRGIEQEFFADSDTSKYEYVIGSAHFIKKNGEYLEMDEKSGVVEAYVKRVYGGDYYAWAKDYYETVAVSGCMDYTDIVGHLDLITKFNEGNRLFDETSKKYLGYAFGAVDEIMKKDKIFEMNTGAVSRGYRKEPYIARPILKYIREKGGRMTVCADAHQAENYNFGFAQCAAILKDCGFKETWQFDGKEFHAEALAE